MTSLGGSPTHLAVVLPAKSADWGACVKCGERMDFESTDGMGRIIPQCPVCDWGWRPSRQYDAFQQRLAALQLPNRDESKMLPQPCIRCEQPFFPMCSAEQYCGDDCRTAAKREQIAKARRGERRCDRCGAFIISLSGKALYCETCRLVRQAEQRRRYWQNKQLRGAA